MSTDLAGALDNAECIIINSKESNTLRFFFRVYMPRSCLKVGAAVLDSTSLTVLDTVSVDFHSSGAV